MSQQEMFVGSRPVREWIDLVAGLITQSSTADPARVRHLLERTARDPHGQPLAGQLGRVLPAKGLQFRPFLPEALQHLPPDDALGLFETEDHERLWAREHLFEFLAEAAPRVPLLALDEMAEILGAFAAHLRRGREALVRTGWPARLCARPGWPACYLWTLYPMDLVGFDVLPLETDEWGDPLLHYHPAAPGPDVPTPDQLPWRDPGDRARLEAMRPTLFDLQVAVLEVLAAAVCRREPAELWPRCLRLLTDALTADDIDFLLQLDAEYHGANVLEHLAASDSVEAPTGGLTGLLTIIGDVEEALTLGLYPRLRAALAPVMVEKRHGLCLGVASYYQLVRSPDWRQRGATLDALLALTPQRGVFWDRFRRRVNAALAGEFKEVLVVRLPVKRSLRYEFEPFYRAFGASAYGYLEATGTLPPWTAFLSPIEVGSGNTFRKESEYWAITYEGSTVRVRDSKGWQYIAFLVRSEGRAFHALAFESAVFGMPAETKGRRDAPAKAELDQENLSLATGGAGFAGEGDMDEHRRRRAEIREYQEDLREAESANDLERAAVLRETIEWLTRDLAAQFDKYGRERDPSDPGERARKRIANAIGLSLKRIVRDHPALHQHLHGAIKRGTTLTYKPTTSAGWIW